VARTPPGGKSNIVIITITTADRDAPRLRRGVSNVWGFGGHIGAPNPIGAFGYASSSSALIAIVPSGVTAHSSQPFGVGRPRSSNGAVSKSGARACVV